MHRMFMTGSSSSLLRQGVAQQPPVGHGRVVQFLEALALDPPPRSAEAGRSGMFSELAAVFAEHVFEVSDVIECLLDLVEPEAYFPQRTFRFRRCSFCRSCGDHGAPFRSV